MKPLSRKKTTDIKINYGKPSSQEQIAKKSDTMEQDKGLQIKNIQMKHKISEEEENSSYYRRRQKFPQSIKSSIKKRTQEEKGDQKINKIGKVLKNKKFNCQICQLDYDQNQKVSITDCSHFYCNPCLKYYIIYKVRRFEKVICPDENCDEVLKTESELFRSLPYNIQKNYRKLYLFYLTSEDPNLHLCPNQNCDEGVLKLIDGVPPQCQICGKIYCQKCLYPLHEGECEMNEVQFFVNNLNYRQCPRCKAIIEKTEGCNQMTCTCGNSFDYSKKAVNAPANNNAAANIGDRLQWLQDEDKGRVACKFIIKIICLFPFYLFALIIFITFRFVLKYIMVLLISIILGITCFTVDFILNLEEFWQRIIAVVFYPFTMFLGVGLFWRNIGFAEIAQEWENNHDILELSSVCFCW